MEDAGTDLRIAVAFVVGRIAEQARRSGEPLEDAEREMLTNFPESLSTPGMAGPETIVLRDLELEKLCRLARDAHKFDSTDAEAARDWRFADAVLRVHRHSMAQLLLPLELNRQRPWRDGWQLFSAGLLLVLCGVGVTVGSALYGKANDLGHRFIAGILVGVCAVVIAGTFYLTVRSEKLRWKRVIEESRR